MNSLRERIFILFVVIFTHFKFNSSFTSIDPSTVIDSSTTIESSTTIDSSTTIESSTTIDSSSTLNTSTTIDLDTIFETSTAFDPNTYSSTEFCCNSTELFDMEQDLSKSLHELELAFAIHFEEDAFDASETGLTFINWLKRQYLKLEQQLWTEIEYHSKENIANSDTQNGLLDMIRISHLVFFNGNFRENAIELNLFDSYDEILFDCISTINRSVAISKETYLNHEELLQNELDTIVIVQDQFGLKKTLDDLYEFISSNYEYLKSVSVCLFVRLVMNP